MIGWYGLKFSHHWGNQVSCSLGPKSAPPPSPLFGLVSRGELWSARCWGSARALSTHRGRTCSFWGRRRQAAPAAQTDLETFSPGCTAGAPGGTQQRLWAHRPRPVKYIPLAVVTSVFMGWKLCATDYSAGLELGCVSHHKSDWGRWVLALLHGACLLFQLQVGALLLPAALQICPSPLC